MMEIKIERAYEFYKKAKPEGSYAILVDRIWPRGISKEKLQLDEWAKHLAPSTELRKWFAHDANKWPEFRRRYREELKPLQCELEQLQEMAQRKQLILLYGAKDTEHNQAVVLKDLLQH
jgi:uncharacterized protein YeaO (DUF488 family)